jgi:predicted GNAT superfamily acetyltransferase
MTTSDEPRSKNRVTDISAPAVTADPVLDEARRSADAAARAAGVSVRELAGIDELNRAVGLLAAIWGRTENPPMTVELLRAFSKAENYVAGAFDGDCLVGVCVGFFHAPASDALHSHIAGVAAAATGRSVGFALKLHQRAWALLRGVSEVAWTFDPLVARNAYFNLAKLAARPVEYLPNFYGPMVDAINGDQDTDRLLVRWRLRDPAVALAASGAGGGAVAEDEIRRGAVRALNIAEDGSPLPGPLDSATALVAVPRDIERLRVTDPALARRWRAAVREVLSGLVRGGGRIDGFDRAGWYVVRSEP